MREVRETLSHLTSLNRFDDVQVFRSRRPAASACATCCSRCIPSIASSSAARSALSEGEIRRVVTERFGRAPSAARAQEVARGDRARSTGDRGYPRRRSRPRIEATHNPDRATMAFDIVGRAARDDRPRRD